MDTVQTGKLLSWLVFLGMNGLLAVSSKISADRLVERDGCLSKRLMAAGLVYFSQITVTVLLLGVALHRLHAAPLAMVNVLVSVVLVFWGWKYQRPLVRPLYAAIRRILGEGDKTLWFVIFLFGLQVTLLVLKSFFLSENTGDTIAYHLPPVVEWFQQGIIPHVYHTPETRVASHALGLSVLSYWFFIFLRADFLVDFPQVLWAVLIPLLVYAWLRKSTVTSGWAVKFGLLAFFMPTILTQSVIAKDHIALNVSFLLGLYFMAEFIRMRDFRQLLLAGMALGLNLGYKLSGIVCFASAWGVMAAYVLWQLKKSGGTLRQGTKMIWPVAASITTSLVIGGYWYFRNFIVYGRLQGAHMEERFNIVTGNVLEILLYRLSVAKDNLYHVLPRVFDFAELYRPDMLNISGFGPQFVTFVIPVMAGLLLFQNKQKKLFDPLLPGVAVMMAFYSVLYFSPWNYRLFSFAAIALIGYAGIFYSNIGFFEKSVSKKLANCLVVACLLWSSAAVLYPAFIGSERMWKFALFPERYKHSANYWYIGNQAPYRFVANCVPVDEPVAYSMALHNYRYLYYDANWKRQVIGYDFQKALQVTEEGYHPTASFKAKLTQEKTSLVVLCDKEQTMVIHDPDFHQIMNGLYYYEK